MTGAAYGLFLDSHESGHLPNRQVFLIEQFHDQQLAGRQPIDGNFDPGRFRRRIVFGLGNIVDGKCHRAPLSQMIEGDVSGNHRHPGRQLGSVRVIFFKQFKIPAAEFDKYILKQVPRLAGIFSGTGEGMTDHMVHHGGNRPDKVFPLPAVTTNQSIDIDMVFSSFHSRFICPDYFATLF